MNNNLIYFSRENDTVILPSKREEDGAFDIYANFEEDYIVIRPHETKMIPTGLRSAFSSDYVAILKERGSTGSKGVGQRCGVIDSGYRGLWFVPLTNHNDKPLIIAKKCASFDVQTKIWGTRSEISTKEIYDSNGNFVVDGESCIIYPYEKAITQVIMVEVPKLAIAEMTPQQILAIASERGEGALGSSNK